MPLVVARVGFALAQALAQNVAQIPQRLFHAPIGIAFNGQFQVRMLGYDDDRMQAGLRYRELRDGENPPNSKKLEEREVSKNSEQAGGKKYTTSQKKELPEFHDQAVS